MTGLLLCSQCGERLAVMVKVGTDDGWCERCLDEAALPTDADVLLALARVMEGVIADGDVAEVAATVPGEVGRSTCIDRRDAIYDDPAGWVRNYAATHPMHLSDLSKRLERERIVRCIRVEAHPRNDEPFNRGMLFAARVVLGSDQYDSRDAHSFCVDKATCPRCTDQRVPAMVEVMGEHRRERQCRSCTGCDWRAPTGTNRTDDPDQTRARHEAFNTHLAELMVHALDGC